MPRNYKFYMKLDVLAFGVHPDDVELGCAGTLLLEKSKGKRTGIIDLTQGEMGTRGTPETRASESARAAKILQVDVRENLRMADGFFGNDEAHQKEIIQVIRRYRPEIILCNAPRDRHPDHGRSAGLVADAAFLSGLMKVETSDAGKIQQAWRPKYVLNYIQDYYLNPNFVIDVSEHFVQKMESIKAYDTQFYTDQKNDDEPETYISTPFFLEGIVNRAKMFGKMIGVEYAEGFISAKMVGLAGLEALILKDT